MAAVGCLPNGGGVLYIQIILYFSASVLAFFVTIPVGVTLRNFWGSCILYGQMVLWGTPIIFPWNEPSCIFVLYMNLAINIFYATFMGFLCLIAYLKKRIEYPNNASLSKLQDWHVSYLLNAFNPVFLIINGCIMILELSSAAILTSGFHQFCKFTNEFVSGYPNKADLYLSRNGTFACSEYSNEDKFWANMRIVRGATKGVYGHSFYGSYVVACIANWILFFIWFAQFFGNILMSCRICSCDIAEEKKKGDKTSIIAARRSRLATPIATPGGRYTPAGMAPGGPTTSQQRLVPQGQPVDPYYSPQREPYPGQQRQPTREPTYPGKEPSYPGKEPSYPGKEPSYPGKEPSYPGKEPYYPGKEPSYPRQQASNLEKPKTVPLTPPPSTIQPSQTYVTPKSNTDGAQGPSPSAAPLSTPKPKQIYKKQTPSSSEMI